MYLKSNSLFDGKELKHHLVLRLAPSMAFQTLVAVSTRLCPFTLTMGNIKAIREGRANPSKMGSFFSEAVGTIAGSLIVQGADPMIAMMAARNAVENNWNAHVRYYDEEILEASDEAYARTGELIKGGYQHLYDMVVNNELAHVGAI